MPAETLLSRQLVRVYTPDKTLNSNMNLHNPHMYTLEAGSLAFKRDA